MKKLKLITALFLSILFILPATALDIKAVNGKKIDNIDIGNVVNGKRNPLQKFSLNANEIKQIEIPSGMLEFNIDGIVSYCYLSEKQPDILLIDENNIVLDKSSALNQNIHEWCSIFSATKYMTEQFYLADNRKKVLQKDSCMNVFLEMNKKANEIIANDRKLTIEQKRIQKLFIRLDFESVVMYYCHIPTIAYSLKIHPDLKNAIVTDNKFADELALEIHPQMGQIVTNYFRFSGKSISCITSDRVKAMHLLNKALSFTSYDQFIQLKKEYGSIFVTEGEKKTLATVEKALSRIAPGSDGYDFAFPDAMGKIVKLSDFKGKVVYVDVWATWCGPCKREIPFLEKLEMEMHGKDVVFVSISVDKDRDKWLTFIKKSKGIQINDPLNQIGKEYNISGIPRFLLFDKNGKVINADAPRPSNRSIISLIEKHL